MRLSVETMRDSEEDFVINKSQNLNSDRNKWRGPCYLLLTILNSISGFVQNNSGSNKGECNVKRNKFEVRLEVRFFNC